MFHDRTDAGKQLAEKLLKYKNKNVVVLAIPRGGVPVGYEIAKALNTDFDLIIPRKLPNPYEPESGIGAVSETDDIILNKEAIYYSGISKKEVEKIISEQKEIIKERVKKLREGKALTNLEYRIAILVDDGLAMGSTMQAAIATARHKKAVKVVVAIPTAGYSVVELISKKADEVVCIDKRKYFRAVADAYENWYDLDDKEVTDIMRKYKKFRGKAKS